MGITLERLPTDEATALLYTLMIDDIVQLGGSRMQARQALDETMSDFEIPEEGRTEQNPQPKLPDRETWGLLPEHQAAQARAMGLLGQNPNLGGEKG